MSRADNISVRALQGHETGITSQDAQHSGRDATDGGQAGQRHSGTGMFFRAGCTATVSADE